MLELDDAHLI